MSKNYLTHADILKAATALVDILDTASEQSYHTYRVYAVPRGGIPAALAFLAASHGRLNVELVDEVQQANLILDDLIDSGATFKRYEQHGTPFYALFSKGPSPHAAVELDKRWVVFPWENAEDGDTSAHDIVTRMLQRIGDDPTREGLQDTPKRVVKAWDTWFGGYHVDPKTVLKVFEDGAEGVDEMVLETDIPVYSFCEHHMAPIFGVAHVAYIPDGKVVGLSKLVRLVDIFARRLQVQERLTNQIADSLMKELNCKGAGVVLQCRHMCMESRGVHSHGVVTTTSALRGCVKDEHDSRAEFLSLIRMSKSNHNSIL